MAVWPAYRFVKFSTLIIVRHFDETTEPRLRCQFFLPRLESQSGELMILSTRADYANGELHVCAAFSRLQHLVDLSHRRDGRFVNAIQDHPALNPGGLCWAVRFHCRN